MTPPIPAPASILIVNDLTHTVIKAMKDLVGLGYSVSRARSFQEMLAKCRETRPDLIVLHTVMPDWVMEPSEIIPAPASSPRAGCLSFPHPGAEVSTASLAAYRPSGSGVQEIIAREVAPPMPRVLFLCWRSSSWNIRWDCTGAVWADVLLLPRGIADLTTVAQRILTGGARVDPSPRLPGFEGVTR